MKWRNLGRDGGGGWHAYPANPRSADVVVVLHITLLVVASSESTGWLGYWTVTRPVLVASLVCVATVQLMFKVNLLQAKAEVGGGVPPKKIYELFFL